MLLRTTRLALRELQDDDLPALRGILTDDETMAAYDGAFTETEVQDWLQRQRVRYRDDGFGLWAVVSPETGEVIGQSGITRQRIGDDEVIEVGYLFRRDRWHHGYATEAASACVDWAFAELPVDAVWAKVRDTNLASMNVAIRLGMRVRRRFVVDYRGPRCRTWASRCRARKGPSGAEPEREDGRARAGPAHAARRSPTWRAP